MPCLACEAYNNPWLCLVLKVTKTNQVQKSIPQSCFSDSLPLPCLRLRLSRLPELVPTLHCLIIILISMLPWMCIAEQNLAFPWCESREEHEILSLSKGLVDLGWGHLCTNRVAAPLWPPIRGPERQRGVLLPNGELCVLSASPLAASEIALVCALLLNSLIHSKHPGPAQVRCPMERMLVALIGASPQHGCWPSIPVVS